MNRQKVPSATTGARVAGEPYYRPGCYRKAAARYVGLPPEGREASANCELTGTRRRAA